MIVIRSRIPIHRRRPGRSTGAFPTFNATAPGDAILHPTPTPVTWLQGVLTGGRLTSFDATTSFNTVPRAEKWRVYDAEVAVGTVQCQLPSGLHCCSSVWLFSTTERRPSMGDSPWLGDPKPGIVCRELPMTAPSFSYEDFADRTNFASNM